MSKREPSRASRTSTASRVKDRKRLLRLRRKTRTKSLLVAHDENYAQQQAKSQTNMKTECEDTFHAVDDTIVSKEWPVTFEQGPIATLESNQTLVCHASTGVRFHTEEAIGEL